MTPTITFERPNQIVTQMYVGGSLHQAKNTNYILIFSFSAIIFLVQKLANPVTQ